MVLLYTILSFAINIRKKSKAASSGGASGFGGPSIQLPMELRKKKKKRWVGREREAQKEFLSLRGRSSLQRKDTKQGTGRKPQKSKDPVQKGSTGYPEAGVMGKDFLKRSDLMRGLGAGRRWTEKKTYE